LKGEIIDVRRLAWRRWLFVVRLQADRSVPRLTSRAFSNVLREATHPVDVKWVRLHWIDEPLTSGDHLTTRRCGVLTFREAAAAGGVSGGIVPSAYRAA
jgi:hypothetical protein